MFQYTRVRESDGVPVVYGHDTTLTEILPRMSERSRREAVSIMLDVLIRERGAHRAEWTDGNMRITHEVVGIKHAYNTEPTVLDLVRLNVAEALTSSTLSPFVEQQLRQAMALMEPEPEAQA